MHTVLKPRCFVPHNAKFISPMFERVGTPPAILRSLNLRPECSTELQWATWDWVASRSPFSARQLPLFPARYALEARQQIYECVPSTQIFAFFRPDRIRLGACGPIHALDFHIRHASPDFPSRIRECQPEKWSINAELRRELPRRHEMRTESSREEMKSFG